MGNPTNGNAGNCPTGGGTIIDTGTCSQACNGQYFCSGGCGTWTCSTGALCANGPDCVGNPCADYSLPSNSVAGNCGSGSTQIHGTVCTATCNGGYTSGGTNTCNLGSWTN